MYSIAVGKGRRLAFGALGSPHISVFLFASNLASADVLHAQSYLSEFGLLIIRRSTSDCGCLYLAIDLDRDFTRGSKGMEQ